MAASTTSGGGAGAVPPGRPPQPPRTRSVSPFRKLRSSWSPQPRKFLCPGCRNSADSSGLDTGKPASANTWCMSRSFSSKATRSFFSTTLLLMRFSTGRDGTLSSLPRRCTISPSRKCASTVSPQTSWPGSSSLTREARTSCCPRTKAASASGPTPTTLVSLQVLRAIAAALVFDRGAAVVGQLHAVAVSAAVEADQARPRVDMGDGAAQLVAVAIAVIVSVAAPVAALADIAYNLDRTRQQ